MNDYLEQAKQLKIGEKFILDYADLSIEEGARTTYDILSLDYTWQSKMISRGKTEYTRIQ